MQSTMLTRYACDLDPYLTSMDAMGTRLRSNLEWLVAQLDGQSTAVHCFFGCPTVDTSNAGLSEGLMSLLHRKRHTTPLIVAAVLPGELSLLCDALQVVTVLGPLGAPVSHCAIEKLGSLSPSVGLDTCYAFITIVGWLRIVLPAHIVWLHCKSSDMGIAFADPTEFDFRAANMIARVWTSWDMVKDSTAASYQGPSTGGSTVQLSGFLTFSRMASVWLHACKGH